MDGAPTETNTVEAALAQEASAADVALGVEALRAFAVRAHSGDDRAFQAFHALMYRLYHDPEHAHYDTRRLLTASVRDIEEDSVPLVSKPQLALAQDAFLDAIETELAAGPKKGQHPLAGYLFGGTSTLEEAKFFLLDHWRRARHFYREFPQFVLRFPPELHEQHLIGLYVLMRDEGMGDQASGYRTHSALLKDLLRSLGLQPKDYDLPPFIETKIYLNNRMRCQMHHNVAWGLGVSIGIEKQTLQVFSNMVKLLQRFDVPSHSYFALHEEVEDEHASIIKTIGVTTLHTADQQRILLSSLRRHMLLAYATMDPVWKAIQAGETPLD
jgi:pyrroloquinoline quinone (PQQ) biosynthesis protein C